MEIALLLALVFAILLASRKGFRSTKLNSPPLRAETLTRPAPAKPDIPAEPEAVKPRPSIPPKEQVVQGRAYVTDGDGLRIKGQEIRLFGVDAPEFKHPYGKMAKWELVALCKGQEVMAISAGQDDHGRMVARCFLADGRDLSAEMVKRGLALDWPKFSGRIYADLEPEGIRNKLWLADARQKGRMDVWEEYEARQRVAG